MSIDQFFDEYFEGLSDSITGFASSGTKFVTVIDLMTDKKLSIVKEQGISGPILVLQEFDDSEDTEENSDLREQKITGVFAVLQHVNQEEQGTDHERTAIRNCRTLAKKVFSQMLKDSISKSGNTLFDNHVDCDTARDSNYVYQIAGTLSGYFTRFTWYVSGNLIEDV